MEYVIKTLNMEISRLTKSIREIRETPFSATDRELGFFPDIRDLDRHIDELNWAIKVLTKVYSWDREKRTNLELPA